MEHNNICKWMRNKSIINIKFKLKKKQNQVEIFFMIINT